MSHNLLKFTRPEIRLLFACLRTESNARTKKHIEELLREDIDWTFLIEIADQHRILPLVFNNVAEKFRPKIPSDVHEYLRSRCHLNTIHSKLLDRELVKIVNLLSDLNISCIPFKGPMSAVTIYGNIAWRQFNDLDILVGQDDYGRVQRFLIEQGYAKVSDWGYESGFQHQSSMINVDIHKTFDNYELAPEFDFNTLSKRLVPIRLSSGQIDGLSIEDTLIGLCINFAKDLFINKTRLSQLGDIANLINLHPELNWPLLVEHTKRIGMKRIFFLCLSLSSTLLKVNLPEEIQKQLRVQNKVKLLASEISERIMDLLCGRTQFYDYPEGRMGRQALYLKLKERIRDKMPEYYKILRHRMVRYKAKAMLGYPWLRKTA